MAVLRNEKGQLLPGHSGLKPKGTIQQRSIELRERIGSFLQAKAEELPGLWEKLSDKEKARLFVDLAAFIIPKQRDIALTAMTEPTRDAVAQIFNFSDPEESAQWADQTRQQVFPAIEEKQ